MRQEKILQTAALFMTVLVLLLPVSFAQSLNQTASQGAITLDAVVPQFSKIKYVDVQGTTAPNAQLEYYIGPTKVKVSRSRSDGSFLTTRVPLTKVGENSLLIKAIVGDQSVQKSFQVFFDSSPPVLTLSEIPSFTTQPAINVHGDVSEPVAIKYGSYPKKDDNAPETVTGLEVRDTQKNQVTLAWTPSTEDDLLEYAIYRDGKRVGVARTAVFLDNSVASGKEYAYHVSAVDTSCNEGPKSASKKAATKSGGNDETPVSAVSLSCATKFATLNTAVPFDITLSLTAGRNIVEIIAEDKAGNVDKIIKEVNLDIGPPQILSTNIDSIGTTYIPDVDVKGQLSEKGTVFVYVNDMSKPAHYGLTDDNGNFEIPIQLKQDIKVESGAAAELDTGVGWENKVKIKAVDLAGQETWYPGPEKTAKIIWAICGYGSWFDFDIEEVSPSILTPRLMMQGVQQIGVPFTLTYIGGQQDAELAGLVNAVPVRLSPDIAEFYDNEKIAVPQVWIQKRADSKVWDGFIQINFANWPVEQLDLGANKTDAAVEKAISDWRRGEYPEAGWGGRGVYLQPGCIDPALGCVKLYLELDIPLKEKVRIYDPQTQQERFEWKTARQRNCLPITLEIDQVIPPDVIRKKSLEATSNFFAQAIELIDKVLDPLTTFTENVMYLCMSSAAAIFLAGVTKRILCSQLVLKKGVDPDIGEAGICKIAYEGDEGKKDSCERCQWAAKTYKNIVEDLYRPICDRLTCPSAPTVQKYILDKKKTPKDITNKISNVPIKEGDLSPRETAIALWGVNGKVYSGSGCGFSEVLSLGYTVEKQPIHERGKRREGESCASDSGCDAGLYCNPFSNTCMVRTEGEIASHSVAKGGYCDKDEQCMTGLVCDVFNRCSEMIKSPAAGTRNIGESCTKDSDCRSGLKCDTTFEYVCYQPSGTSTLSKAGQECGEDDDCVEGLICDKTLGICKVGSRLTGGAAIDVSSAFTTGSAVAAVAGQTASTTTTSTSQKTGAYPDNTICGYTFSELGIKGNQIGVKELYDVYKGTEQWAQVKKDCTNSSLHPACPLCCGIDYMWEWNSACGIGNFLGTTKVVDLDTFDELKHSVQLAAEKAGKGDEFGTPNILNFLSGFCTPEGNPTPDVVRTGLNFNPKISEAEENALQVFVFPDSTATGESFKYKVYRGYFAKSFVIESAQKAENKKYREDEMYKFSSTLVAIKDTDLTQFFSSTGNEDTQKKGFADALCKNVGASKLEGKQSCSKVADDVFNKVKGHVGTVDQEYIVKPNDGIINSIRCICFPSLIAYLKQWRAISVAIKNCIDLIRLTGDGSEGQCRSLLSTYVCDLLWEIISCFVNKWSAPSGSRLSAEAGIGSVLGILTGAGSDLSNEVKGRYGETATFNAMFNEKELVHGLCLLAFGLEWNVDVSAMVQQSVASIPVETTVLGPTPCQSRFIAWNPITNPRGLTTWEYHFGIMAAAGADITTRVKLKCSSGFECSETDGFVGGECDCNKGGAQEITITPACKPAWKSQVKKDELVSLDCTYLAQQAKQRYDTLTFEYDWYDTGTKQRVTKSSQCKINMVGSAPPSFCRFDPLTASFRCRYGESPSGIRLETVTPKYNCQVKKDNPMLVFALDENPKFELLVNQMMPDEPSEMDQGIKFLGYKITNANGDVVKEVNPASDPLTIQLKTDGNYKELVEIPNDKNWKKFFATAGAAQLPITVWASDVALANKIRSAPQDYINDVVVKYTENGKATSPADKFVVDIQNNDIRVYVYRGKADAYLTDSKYQVFDGKGQVKKGQTYTMKYNKDETKVYDISFKLVSNDLFGTNKVQYLIDYAKGTPAKDPCTNPDETVTWNAEFTSYDADKYGRVTSQVSVDPKTGEKQVKSAAFKMSCFTQENLHCLTPIPSEVKTTAIPTELKFAIDLTPRDAGIVLDAITYIDNYETTSTTRFARLYKSTDKNNKPSPGEIGVIIFGLENKGIEDFKNIRVNLTAPSGVKVQWISLDDNTPYNTFSGAFDLPTTGNDRYKNIAYLVTIPEYYSKEEILMTLAIQDYIGEPMVAPGIALTTATGVSCDDIDACADYVEQDCKENICSANMPYGCRYDSARQACISKTSTATSEQVQFSMTFDPAGESVTLDPFDYYDNPYTGGVVWATYYDSVDNNNQPSLGETGVLRFRLENKGSDALDDIRAELTSPVSDVVIKFFDPVTKSLSSTVSSDFTLGLIGTQREHMLSYILTLPEEYDSSNIPFTLSLKGVTKTGPGPVTYTASGQSCTQINTCQNYNSQDCNVNVCNINMPYGCFYNIARRTCQSLPHKIESVALMDNGVSLAELSTSQSSPTKAQIGVRYNMQVKTSAKVPYVYDTLYAENGNVLFPASKFVENNDDVFNKELYSSIERKLKIGIALKDQNGVTLSQKEYWVEFARSLCSESYGVCADSCTEIAREASEFSCTGGRQCCVSPVIFKNGRQVPTSCADYGGFCSASCVIGETEIPYYDLGCGSDAVCCVTTINNACPGVCAPDCAQVYDNIGKSDCSSGSTCCAD